MYTFILMNCLHLTVIRTKSLPQFEFESRDAMGFSFISTYRPQKNYRKLDRRSYLLLLWASDKHSAWLIFLPFVPWIWTIFQTSDKLGIFNTAVFFLLSNLGRDRAFFDLMRSTPGPWFQLYQRPTWSNMCTQSDIKKLRDDSLKLHFQRTNYLLFRCGAEYFYHISKR